MKREDAQYPINIHGDVMRNWKTTTGSLHDPHNVPRETIENLLEERSLIVYEYIQFGGSKRSWKRKIEIDLLLADMGYVEKDHGFID